MENEEKYKSIKAEILGEDSDEDEGSGSDESSDEEEAEGMLSPLFQVGHLLSLPQKLWK